MREVVIRNPTSKLGNDANRAASAAQSKMQRAVTDDEGSLCDALFEGNTRLHLALHFSVHTSKE
jgi:hypothetical protein